MSACFSARTVCHVGKRNGLIYALELTSVISTRIYLYRRGMLFCKTWPWHPLSILTRGAPYCPECQGRMAKKRARKGTHAGKVFWRCLRYPECRGRRTV